MVIQQGNAVCVMGCPKDTSSGLEGLFYFQVHEAEELNKIKFLSAFGNFEFLHFFNSTNHKTAQEWKLNAVI